MGKKKKKGNKGKKKGQLKKYPRCWKDIGGIKKISYPDESTALKGVRAMWTHRTNVDISDISVYECFFCHGWHIGHKSKYKAYLEKHKPLEIAK